MRKYVTGIFAILIAGICIAFTKKNAPPGECTVGKNYIWYLVEVGQDVDCASNLTYVSPSVLSLYGHETLFGPFSIDPRSELTGQGWLMTFYDMMDMGYGCGIPNQILCAVAYDPIYVTPTSFRKVNVNGVWYWQPREPWGFGPPLGCFICRPYY